jgi:chromate reductase
MGQPELYLHFTDGLIDSEGNITNDNSKKFLQKFVDAFVTWITQHAKR